MKICSKCGFTKPETEFYVKDKVSNRLHTQCKDCYKEQRKLSYADHYGKYNEEYRRRAREYREKLRNEFRENILRYLSEKHCLMCGESDIRTFEFDHINPAEKDFSVSQAVRLGYRWEKVETELQKCRILCANCHKKHTAEQYGWYKLLK